MKTSKKLLAMVLIIITVFSTCSTVFPVFAESLTALPKTVIEESNEVVGNNSKIVKEDTGLREEYAKHFICEDGTYIVATYPNPVHYKDNGKWKEINNNLILSADSLSSSGQAMYVPKAGDLDIRLPQSFSNNQKISATNKGYTISFGVHKEDNVQLKKKAEVVNDVASLTSNTLSRKEDLSQNSIQKSSKIITKENRIQAYNRDATAVDNQAGSLVYKNIFSEADLEYIVTTNSIKENIVINSRQDEYVYKFDMNFGELIPVVNDNNSISLVKQDNIDETVFYIDAPYMYDAVGEESIDIETSLQSENGTYVLTLRPNSEWINNEQRSFPIVIDPTTYLSYGDAFVMDGLTNKDSTKINKELRVGRNLTNLTRTYIKPVYPTNIPKGSYINSASLTLSKDNYYQAPSANGDMLAVLLYDCSNVASWSPATITWNNQPFNNSTNGYKNNTEAICCARQQMLSDKSEYSFDISSLAVKWVNSGINNGVMLASSKESSKTQIDFHSSRASDSVSGPRVLISYTVPNVSISNWETDSNANESSDFAITTSGSWTASSNASWISLSKTSGTGVENSKIIVSENKSLSERTGTVTVKIGTTVIGTIAVKQYGKEPYITLAPTELSFDVGKNKKVINVESNTAWSFSNLPDWISVTPAQGSKNSTVEIEALANNSTATRTCSVSVTADSVTKSISISQLGDTQAPTKPDIYEENGLVYISMRSFDFNENTETEEHIEYKLGNGEWVRYKDVPLSVVHTFDVTIYARVCDAAGNASEEASFVLKNNLGEYTASYNDIALGEGALSVDFIRTYSSKNGWFFSFEANVQPFTNGYVFTDFYGNRQYFISNNEGKYLSAYDDELKVESGTICGVNYAYSAPYGELECYFNSAGKLAAVKSLYNTETYSWSDNGVVISDGNNNTNTVVYNNGKPISVSVSRIDPKTNSAVSRSVQYQWDGEMLTKFIDAANAEHNYAYTNGLLTSNDTETVTYSEQDRVKKIQQKNGAFVKYTYNDTVRENESDVNCGAVIVSDSKGITDIWQYETDTYFSDSISNYSDNAVYAPGSISDDIIADNVANICYVVDSIQENETGGSDEDNEPEASDSSDPDCTYDANGNILTETYFEKVDNTTFIKEKYTYEYTNDGKLKTEVYYKADEERNLALIYRYIYDADGNIVTETYYKKVSINGSTTYDVSENYSREYNNGHLISEVYRKVEEGLWVDSKKTQYVYNEFDNVVKYSTGKWFFDNWYETYREEYSYDVYGNLTSQIVTKFNNSLSSANQVETTSETTSTTYEYDAWCRKVASTEKVNGVVKSNTVVTYDTYGRTTSVTENGKTTSYTYNNDGSVNTVSENNKVTSFSYSDNGNLISKTNPDGTVANYSYDNYGNLSGHVYNGYSFTYNTFGNILAANSESSQLVGFSYSADTRQNIVNANFGNGQSVNYEYDSDGRISAVKLGNETKYGYSYQSENGSEELTEITDYVNNVKKIIEDNKVTVNDLNGKFIYSIENISKDGDSQNSFRGRIERSIYQTYEVKYSEDKDIYSSSFSGFERLFNNNDNGTLSDTSIIFGRTNPFFKTNYDYNADEAVSLMTHSLSDWYTGVKKSTISYGYAYDEDGRIKTESFTETSKDENEATVESVVTTNYAYDENNQLSTAENNSSKWEYSYDGRGNIVNKTKYSITVDSEGQKSYNETKNDVYAYDETWKDKLTSYNGQTISYDDSGNPMSYLGHNLTWTMGRQLATFDEISYTYNEDGLRTSKTVNGKKTQYYYDGTRLIQQYDGDNTLHFTYDRNGEVIGFTHFCLTTGVDDPVMTEYFYLKNVQGDIVGITDVRGNIKARYTYDPWGGVIAVEKNLDSYERDIVEMNPLLYRGYVYDSETGLYYLRSRYYDPEVGRFINCDDVNYIGTTESELSYNAFAYCGNDPVNHSDPSGRLQKELAMVYAAINYFQTLNASPKERRAYIYDQNVGYISNLIYGGFPISYNGCELIAVYNALKYLGKFMLFYEVIYYAEINDWYLFPVIPTGVFGSTPRKAKKLFDEKNLKYAIYQNYQSKDFEKNIKDGKICIATYSNKSSKLIYNLSIHTFAFYYNKKRKKFYVFNGYNTYSDKAYTYSNYSDLRKGGRYFLYGIIFK